MNLILLKQQLVERIMQVDSFADAEELNFPMTNPTAEDQNEWLEGFLKAMRTHIEGVIEECQTLDPMKMYHAPNTASYDSNHTVLLSFQYGEHSAQIISKMGGNLYGSELIASYRDAGDGGVSVSTDNPMNKAHCVFEDPEAKYSYVDEIHFFHASRQQKTLGVEEAFRYLTGIQIVGYDGEGYEG